jgi:transmembrane sensor
MSRHDVQRLEAAARFLDSLESRQPSTEQLQEWLQWIRASDANRKAHDRMEALWSELSQHDIGKGEAIDDDADYDGSISIHDWLLKRQQRICGSETKRRRVWRGGLMSMAALLATLLVAGAVLLYRAPEASGHLDTFVTGVAEHSDITLPDGSHVQLGARSKVTIDYTRQRRELRLVRGEAYFAVRKDPNRPFLVDVLNGTITALGTAFDVRTTNKRVVVAVADGSVRVDSTAGTAASQAVDPATAHALTKLTRGQSIAFESDATGTALSAGAVTQIDPDQSARWREGWLIYRDEALRDVIADVGRYTNLRIVMAQNVDPKHFTGVVHKDSITEWLQSLPQVFPVTIQSDGDQVLIGPAHEP